MALSRADSGTRNIGNRFCGLNVRVNKPPECNYGSLGCKMSAVTPPLWRREGVPEYLTACASGKYSSDELQLGDFSVTDSSMTERGSHGGKITDLSSRSFKGFLLGSAPFRQGLNCSAIIAVMSKGNLPQTEAGSSVAIAPGKAELLSFLKCQPGTGTGNCAVISSCALSSCCPRQQRQAGPFRTGGSIQNPPVTCSTAKPEYSD